MINLLARVRSVVPSRLFVAIVALCLLAWSAMPLAAEEPDAPVNWVENPGFAAGFDGWRLYIHHDDAEPEEVEPSFVDGRDEGEQAVRVEVEPAQLRILDQHVEQVLNEGESYRVHLRYRQEVAEEATSDTVPVRLLLMTYPKRGKRQPHDKLWVHSPQESTDGWAELTGIFEAQENYTGFRVGVFINAPGIYDVDEVSVSPVKASEATDATDDAE